MPINVQLADGTQGTVETEESAKAVEAAGGKRLGSDGKEHGFWSDVWDQYADPEGERGKEAAARQEKIADHVSYGAVRGASWGLAPGIVKKGAELVGADDFAREQQAKFDEAEASTEGKAAEFVGALAAPVPGAGLVGNAAKGAIKGGSWLARAGRAVLPHAATGGLIGAYAGTGRAVNEALIEDKNLLSSEVLADVAESAMHEGLTGFVLGGGIGALGGGIGAVARKAGGALRKAVGTADVLDRWLPGAEQAAEDVAGSAERKTIVSPEYTGEDLAAAGPKAGEVTEKPVGEAQLWKEKVRDELNPQIYERDRAAALEREENTKNDFLHAMGLKGYVDNELINRMRAEWPPETWSNELQADIREAVAAYEKGGRGAMRAMRAEKNARLMQESAAKEKEAEILARAKSGEGEAIAAADRPTREVSESSSRPTRELPSSKVEEGIAKLDEPVDAEGARADRKWEQLQEQENVARAQKLEGIQKAPTMALPEYVAPAGPRNAPAIEGRAASGPTADSAWIGSNKGDRPAMQLKHDPHGGMRERAWEIAARGLNPSIDDEREWESFVKARDGLPGGLKGIGELMFRYKILRPGEGLAGNVAGKRDLYNRAFEAVNKIDGELQDVLKRSKAVVSNEYVAERLREVSADLAKRDPSGQAVRDYINATADAFGSIGGDIGVRDLRHKWEIPASEKGFPQGQQVTSEWVGTPAERAERYMRTVFADIGRAAVEKEGLADKQWLDANNRDFSGLIHIQNKLQGLAGKKVGLTAGDVLMGAAGAGLGGISGALEGMALGVAKRVAADRGPFAAAAALHAMADKGTINGASLAHALGGADSAMANMMERSERVRGIMGQAIKGFLSGAVKPSSIVKMAGYSSRKDYEARKAEVMRLAQNPHAIMQAMAPDGHSAVAVAAPETAAYMAAHVAGTAQYLSDRLPKDPDVNQGYLGGSRAFKSEKARPEELRWMNIASVVNRPIEAFRRLEAGTLTREQAEALKETNAPLYNSLKSSLMAEITARGPDKPLTFRQQQAVAALFGEPTNVRQTPENTRILQDANKDLEPEQEDNPQGQPPQPGPPVWGKGAFATPADGIGQP